MKNVLWINISCFLFNVMYKYKKLKLIIFSIFFTTTFVFVGKINTFEKYETNLSHYLEISFLKNVQIKEQKGIFTLKEKYIFF